MEEKQRIVYTIEEYHNLKCEKQHRIGIGKDGKPIFERCMQPIRCSRTIREITTDKQHAIDTTANKLNWASVEHNLT